MGPQYPTDTPRYAAKPLAWLELFLPEHQLAVLLIENDSDIQQMLRNFAEDVGQHLADGNRGQRVSK